MSRKLAWTGTVDCVAFSVAESKSDVFFLVSTPDDAGLGMYPFQV